LGSVWRNEKPGPGRFREFLQFDADYVGTKNLQADAELCVLISEILEKCGLDKADYTVKISSRKFTDKLFEQLKIKSKDQISTTLRALDKIDRLGWGEAKKLLGEGRKDKSGDYTKGANLKSDQIKIIENALKSKIPDSEDVLEIVKIFQAYNFKNYKFDPSVIRGLEYYTGPIFEVNLNFEVKNSKGQAIQFGSIGGGGRYDNLVSNFGNLDCPATGISIGLDRLVLALMQKKDFKIKATRPIIICVFDKSKIKEYVEILNKLRMSNISSEIYPGEGRLKKQMEYANKIRSPAVILYGDNEIKSGKATLRNLKTGNESSVKIEDLANEIKKLL
jgi:histidyl-tRNA synthetase